MPRTITPEQTAEHLKRAAELLTTGHIATMSRSRPSQVQYELYVESIGIIPNVPEVERPGMTDGDPGEVYMMCRERAHGLGSGFTAHPVRYFITDYTYVPFPEE